jgi:hypothetical protein
LEGYVAGDSRGQELNRLYATGHEQSDRTTVPRRDTSAAAIRARAGGQLVTLAAIAEATG